MGLVLKYSEGVQKELIPADTYPAVFAGVVELGTQNGGQYGPKQKVRIWWEIPSVRDRFQHEGKEIDRPRIIGQNYNLTFNEKSYLYKDLIGARGRPFTPEELNAFDLFTVIGAPCLLSVIHDQYQGKTLAKIDGIMKLPKGMQAPALEGDPVRFSFDDWGGGGKPDDLPEWMWEKIKESPEYQKGLPSGGGLDPMRGPDPDGFGAGDFGDDDQIPF